MMFAKGCLMYALTLYTLFLFQLYERVTFSSLQRFPPELPPKPLLTIALSLSQKCALCHKNKIFFHINLPKKEQKQQHDFRRRGRKLQKRISRTKKKRQTKRVSPNILPCNFFDHVYFLPPFFILWVERNCSFLNSHFYFYSVANFFDNREKKYKNGSASIPRPTPPLSSRARRWRSVQCLCRPIPDPSASTPPPVPLKFVAVRRYSHGGRRRPVTAGGWKQ